MSILLPKKFLEENNANQEPPSQVAFYTSYKNSKVEEIFPEWAESGLEDLIGEMSKLDIILITAQINYWYQGLQSTIPNLQNKTIEFFSKILDLNLDSSTKIKITSLTGRLANQKSLLLNRLQLASIINLTLRNNSRKKGITVVDNIEKFLAILFLINDEIEKNGTTEKIETTQMALIRTYEMNKTSNLWSALIRYYQILKLVSFKTNTFDELLNKFKGINLDEVFAIIFGIHSSYVALNEDTIFSNFIINLDIIFKNCGRGIKTKAKDLLTGFSQTRTGFYKLSKKETTNKYIDLFNIWKYPFLRIDKRLVLLDFKSLVDQSTVGIFWAIHDKFKSTKDKELLKASYGSAIETYCRNFAEKSILESDFNQNNHELILPETDSVLFDSKLPKVDLVIFTKPNIFLLIEFTSSRVLYKDIFELNHKAYTDKVKEVLFGNADHPQSKLKQFKSTEEGIVSNHIKWGVPLPERKLFKFYRILVQDQPFVPFPKLWDDMYSKLYEEALGRKYDHQNDFIYFMDLDDYESLLLLFYHGENPYTLLDKFKSGGYLNFSNLLHSDDKVYTAPFNKEIVEEFNKRVRNILNMKKGT